MDSSRRWTHVGNDELLLLKVVELEMKFWRLWMKGKEREGGKEGELGGGVSRVLMWKRMKRRTQVARR